MAIEKEYRCLAHGVFSTTASPARCPHGCKSIVRYFSQAPAFKSDRSKLQDRMTRWQAGQLGMTNVSNAQGRTVTENAQRENWRDNPLDMRPRTIPASAALGMGSGHHGALFQGPTVSGDQAAGPLPQGPAALQSRTHAYADPRGDQK